MLSRSRSTAVASVLAFSMLAACTPTAPTDPTPSFTSTPSPSVTPDPFAEAERIYRRAEAVNSRYFSVGKYDRFPDEMYELAMDPYLTALKEDYAQSAEKGVKMHGLETVTYEMAPFHDDLGVGAAVVIRSCSDYRGVAFTEHGQDAGVGSLRYERIYLKYDDGKLKIFGIKSEQAVKCTLE